MSVNERLRAFTSVYKRFRVVLAAIHAGIVMGCDGGLLSAGGSVEPLMCVVQELCNLWHSGACLDVKCRVKSGHVGSSRYKSGQSGRYFFSGNCCRYAFASVFPFPASIPGSGSLSTTRIHDFHRRRTQVGPLAAGGQGVVSGRFRSV